MPWQVWMRLAGVGGVISCGQKGGVTEEGSNGEWIVSGWLLVLCVNLSIRPMLFDRHILWHSSQIRIS